MKEHPDNGPGIAILGVLLAVVVWVPSCVVVSIASGSEDTGFFYAHTVSIGIAVVSIFAGILVSAAHTKRREKEAKLKAQLRKKEAAEARKRRALEEKRRTEANQAQLSKNIETGANEALELFEAMPVYLAKAKDLLGQAELDFEDGAFSPFWNSIEKATRNLAVFDDSTRRISSHFENHQELKEQYEGSPGPFPVSLDSVEGMTAAAATADRLDSIVRKAQRDFQFALIYEQRKTSRILAAGFTTLGEALDGLGHQIHQSIQELGERVAEESNKVRDSIDDVGLRIEAESETVASSVDALHQSTNEHQREFKRRHDQTLELLSSIRDRADD